jgi:predicted HTH transcriptional regulator
MENEELIQLIMHGREERNLEYKGDIGWNDTSIRAKLTRSILALSNIRDGGVIVVGVKQNDDTFQPRGLSNKNFESFVQDYISEYVNEYADPYVEIKINKIKYKSKRFVIIQVQEFPEVPTVCKKDGSDGLNRGIIFTRPRRKIESVKVPTQADMREILDLAIEKGIVNFRQKIRRSGYRIVDLEERDRKMFDDETEGL